MEKIHFVTGRLAEKALKQQVVDLAKEFDFAPTVQVLPISVAALMTPAWISKHLVVPEDTDRVIVPGYCHDISMIMEKTQVPVEVGPKDLRRLREHFGGKAQTPSDFGDWDIEIIGEINHAPRLSLDEFSELAQAYANNGADIIDVGCLPGEVCPLIGDYVRTLKDLGLRVSVDSLEPDEIALATRAGAELVLSVNASNRDYASDWGSEVVVIPDNFQDLAGMEDTLEQMQKHNVPFRIDPILEPIGCGFAASLQRYAETRQRFPSEEIMMGIGNITELTDVDSAGINMVLLGICQELEIRSVLTTQVINWARSSIKECDIARRLVHYAIRHQIPPKHLNSDLVSLRDTSQNAYSFEYLAELAGQIKDHNFRLFADGENIHVLGERQHFYDNDPFLVFDKMVDHGFNNLDASHSFYLGFEMCKAMIANQLGKEYTQDEALNWGHLTVDEVDRHRLQKRNNQKRQLEP